MRFFIVTTIFTFSLFSIISCKPHSANSITGESKNPATHHVTNISKKPNQAESSRNTYARSLEQKKYILSKGGIGSIALGEKYNSNEFTKYDTQLEGVDDCFLADSKIYPEHQHSLSFQFIDHTLTGINISRMGSVNFDKFKTYTGIHIGDSVETIIKAHNKQPDEILNNPHDDEPVFIYWTDNTKTTGIRYDISSNEVLSMGLYRQAHIRYFEGCG